MLIQHMYREIFEEGGGSVMYGSTKLMSTKSQVDASLYVTIVYLLHDLLVEVR